MLTVGDKFPALTLPVQQGTSALPNGETIDLLTELLNCVDCQQCATACGLCQ